jgi:hypothetical protein
MGDTDRTRESRLPHLPAIGCSSGVAASVRPGQSSQGIRLSLCSRAGLCPSGTQRRHSAFPGWRLPGTEASYGLPAKVPGLQLPPLRSPLPDPGKENGIPTGELMQDRPNIEAGRLTEVNHVNAPYLNPVHISISERAA